ncbi:MAG: mechanosensitive ion channel family protein [Methylococcaceae bacterium]
MSEIYRLIDIAMAWAVSPKFYAQGTVIVLAVAAAMLLSLLLLKRVLLFRVQAEEGAFLAIRRTVFSLRKLLFPIFCVVFLAIAIEISLVLVEQSWMVKIAQGLSVVLLLYSVITRFIKNTFINAIFRWVGIPVAILYVFGWLDDTTLFLDSIALELGNIRLSAYALARIVIFGSILFWLGRISNNAGQNAIRNNEMLDIRTKELFAKLFEIALYIAVGLLLLQIVGLDLTALAVFGGALGVGLGFGLQQIASNFISGIIILLDRSLTVGDYIELENGKAGFLRELNMRSSNIQTFDGKVIVVPNEQFITTTFTNWTHQDSRQRYDIEFSVSYESDIEKVPEILIAAISKHPQVLQQPELPDCEIRDFAESGVLFGVEYWIEGIDDGKNRVDADLRMIIWKTLKENQIKMPYPQREVRIIK